MVILDFSSGTVVIRFIPMSMIEMDAGDIMLEMQDEWGVKESDCQYMAVGTNDYIDDTTKN